MHNKKLYGTVTVGTKGQVVIPAEARETFNIQSGDRLYVIGATDSSKWLALIPEEQLRDLINSFTDHLESFKDMLDDSKKDK